MLQFLTIIIVGCLLWINVDKLRKSIYIYCFIIHQFLVCIVKTTFCLLLLMQTHIYINNGPDARKPTFRGMGTTKVQTSLHIHALRVWSVHLLFIYWKVSNLVSVAEQARLNITLMETSKTARPIIDSESTYIFPFINNLHGRNRNDLLWIHTVFTKIRLLWIGSTLCAMYRH